MRLIDTHCHLESPWFEGRVDAILEDARHAGVVGFVTASIAPEQWPESRALAARQADVVCALGVHPWYVRAEHLAAIPDLRRAREWGACALGEIGLDRKVDAPTFDLQEHAFQQQLEIAHELELPVVVHCRGAFDDLLRILRRHGRLPGGGIMHNFSGSPELLREVARHGLGVSLGGTLTYRNSRKKREVIQAAYPEHLMLETDSPDIPPVEIRTRPNVPSTILYPLRAAAEILGLPEEEVAESTTLNAQRLFFSLDS